MKTFYCWIKAANGASIQVSVLSETAGNAMQQFKALYGNQVISGVSWG
jgi:hypothetical protein